MTAPPFHLEITDEADQILQDLVKRHQYADKLRKVRKTLRLLRDPGPRHPGRNSHPYQSVKGPGGAQLWESYVENNTPSAWRIFWIYGPADDTITIVTMGPHP